MSTINRILDLNQQAVNLAFISSYIPRKCGIATFSKDLTKAINDLNPKNPVQIVALNDGEKYNYPHEVFYQIEQENLEDYASAAKFINESKTDIVCLQHEYGLYGGPAGEYVFKLISRLRQPIVTTLHTILVNPSEMERDVLFRLAKASETIVAMVPDAKVRLERDYGINPDKVVIIHHGVADRPKSIKASKSHFGWENRPVLLISGLLNPNKGIDYVLRALPKIKEKFPELLFVIAGQTHPGIIRESGESYRESLEKIVHENSLEENVLFVNKYLSLDDLLMYYDACDIYLTPYLDAQQITSGTLAYALGMGKACISTPYVYAKEMLDHGTGLFVDYKNSEEITAAVLEILENPAKAAQMEEKAYKVGRHMSWFLVAERYLMLFRIVQETYGIQYHLD